MDAKGREFGVGLKIMIQRLRAGAALAAVAEVADGHGGFGVEGQPDGAGIGIRLGVDAVDGFENGVGVRHLCGETLATAHLKAIEADHALSNSCRSLRTVVRSHPSSRLPQAAPPRPMPMTTMAMNNRRA